MRGLVTVFIVLALASSAAASYIQVISSFKGRYEYYPPNGCSAYGVEYDGSNLWTVHSACYLVKRRYPGGSILSTYSFSPRLALPPGMAYDGAYFYTTDALQSVPHIYKIDAAAPRIVGSFPYPAGMTFCGGLAYDGANLYFAALWRPWLWVMTTDGSILRTYDMGISMPAGLAYDDRTTGGPFLWCADEPKERITHIYKMTTNGSVLDSAKWPINNSHLVGLAFDGTYLWGVETAETYNDNCIYRVYYYSDSGVTPASAGRIKALYR